MLLNLAMKCEKGRIHVDLDYLVLMYRLMKHYWCFVHCSKALVVVYRSIKKLSTIYETVVSAIPLRRYCDNCVYELIVKLK
jgi:hypothetical protein